MSIESTLLAIGPDSLIALGDGTLQYLYDQTLVLLLDGTDLFEQACVTIMPATEPPLFPFNAYQTNYPYCRVALQYRMDDPRASPMVGQLVAVAPTMSIKIMLKGCDRRQPISITYDLTQPVLTKSCSVAVYPGYTPEELILVVDTTQLTLPARFTFRATNGAVEREFWVGLRGSRSGPASGSVNLRAGAV